MWWVVGGICGLAWVISIATAAYVGYRWNKLTLRVKDIETSLQEVLTYKQDKPALKEPIKSSLIDPTDLRQQIQWEQDQMEKQLNQ